MTKQISFILTITAALTLAALAQGNGNAGVITIQRLHSTPGTYFATIRLTDNCGKVSVGQISFFIALNCSVTLNPTSVPAATAGVPYSHTFNASGGAAPYSYALVSGGNFPPGMLWYPTSGTFTSQTGSFVQAGNYNFSVKVTDANGCTAQRAYTFVVKAGCPFVSIVPASLPAMLVGNAFNQSLSANGGSAPYSFAVTNGILPAGISLNAQGALTGTPMIAGDTSFTVTATAAQGCKGTRTYNVTIQPRAASPASRRRAMSPTRWRAR